jgi:hypothetical protein
VKITYKVGNAVIEAEGKTVKEVFKELAQAAEAVGDPGCGSCKKTYITPHWREVDGNDYFELVCQACGARLSLGQNKTGGGLFPKRKMGPDGMPAGKDEEGVFDKEKRGWHFYRKPSEPEQASRKSGGGR